MKVVDTHQPPVVFLENVPNLLTHDRGNTWAIMTAELQVRDYCVFVSVINAAGYVPQSRKRAIIVAFRNGGRGALGKFYWPEPLPDTNAARLKDILEDSPDPKYTLSDKLWAYLQNYAAKHKAAGNGFGYSIADLNGQTRTLSARYGKDGSEILIPQVGKNPRKLTPRECARLMGFPDREIVVSDTQAWKQFGNAVVPAVIEAVGRQIVKAMRW